MVAQISDRRCFHRDTNLYHNGTKVKASLFDRLNVDENGPTIRRRSRATLSKIEARLRCVTDLELEILAEALGVEIKALYPAKRNGLFR